MIIRSLTLRHGRLALPKPSAPSRSWRRCLAVSASYQKEAQQIQDSNGRQTTAHYLEIRDPSHPVAQDWAFFQHQKARTQDVGSTIGPHYRPHELLSNPPRPQDITLELLMASQAHIGHATSLWNPANAKYIFGIKGQHDPIHIISLETTAAYLRRACKVVSGVAARGGLILFVGTRPHQARTVVKAAQLAKGCHLFNKWIPGSITNGQQILGSCRKQVVNEFDEEVLGFDDQLQTTSALKPDLVVCLNPLENYILLHECGLHNIPTIGIVDTDVNPTWVTYPIPANDDSLRCVQIICGALGRAGEQGQAARLAQAKQGIVVTSPSHGLERPKPGQEQRDKEARERAMSAEATYEEDGEIVLESLSEDQGVFSGPPPAAERTLLELQDEEGVVYRPSMGAEVRSDPVDMDDISEDTDLGSSLSNENDDAYADASFQPYERDRPLSEDELAQAPQSDDRGR